jgi:small subunit ribosomal protein S20
MNPAYPHDRSEGGDLSTRSAEKAHRQSLKRRFRNRAAKSATKTAVNKATNAILSRDLDAAREAVRAALVALDKAAQKGVLHANNAARHKSRLLIKYNAAVAVRQAGAGEETAPKKGRARKADDVEDKKTRVAKKGASARKPGTKAK